MVIDKYSIGIVCPSDFVMPQPFGGARGFVENMISELQYPAVIYGIGINGSTPWKPIFVKPHVRFIPISDFKYPSAIPMRLKSLFGYLRFRRRILQSGIDILYVHSPECVLPFLFCNRHVPIVFHQHGSGNALARSKFAWGRCRALERLFDLILREIHKRADWIILIDQFCLEQAKSNGAEDRVSLLMNAVDNKKFTPNEESRRRMRKNLGFADELYVILFAGRLEEIKRVDRVIDSMSHLRSEEVSFYLCVAGDGSLKRHLEKYVTRGHLQSSVVLLGTVPHDDLAHYYNMADVLVLPSEMEGVPMVLLEALACGTPVIASMVGGIPEFVVNGVNGVLLNDVSPKTIAAAIKQVRSHDFSRQAIADSVRPYSSTQFVVELEKIMRKITERNGGCCVG